MTKAISTADSSIIALDKFIQATRDSGYKGTPSAIAELVDNALQAGARRINIRVLRTTNSKTDASEVVVQDDGAGMDPFTLRQALRFGGSTRFNDRTGLGRYGMGLPNSSLSQARRVSVYTWRPGTEVYMSYLDLDEIAEGNVSEVPVPRETDYPLEGEFAETGTIVIWSRCDRLDHQRASTITRKLHAALGRRFRYFIWDGVTITVNGEPVEPLDPLFLHPSAKYNGAYPFGEVIEYRVQPEPSGHPDGVGSVCVQFSELPVHEWHKLTNDQKRKLGISKGAGISVVRAGREVDYGWFFLGGKRRENYDDWWRCEIQFDPVLDEAFGITHTKQQIRPKSYLIEALSPDIEAIARTLNRRARQAHLRAKAAERFSRAEELASQREVLLAPLPPIPLGRDQAVLEHLKSAHPGLRRPASKATQGTKPDDDLQLRYRIVESTVGDRSFYTYGRQEGQIVLALNPHHPFYKHVYKPLAESSTPRDQQLRTQVELMLLSLTRSEASEDDREASACLERHRLRWSDTLATFLNG